MPDGVTQVTHDQSCGLIAIWGRVPRPMTPAAPWMSSPSSIQTMCARPWKSCASPTHVVDPGPGAPSEVRMSILGAAVARAWSPERAPPSRQPAVVETSRTSAENQQARVAAWRTSRSRSPARSHGVGGARGGRVTGQLAGWGGPEGYKDDHRQHQDPQQQDRSHRVESHGAMLGEARGSPHREISRDGRGISRLRAGAPLPRLMVCLP
jgi:hypothetical protein